MERENDTSSIWLNVELHFFETGNAYTRKCELLSPIIDKDIFWEKLLNFVNDYLNKQEDEIEKQL